MERARMKQYDVHLYVTVLVKARTVEARSQAEALRAAESFVYPDLHSIFDKKSPTITIACVEFSEDISGGMVDEVGDSQYRRSRWHPF